VPIFHTRGALADEYIAAMRTLFETDAPDFHGAHIDYSDVLFSPKPSVPLRVVVGSARYAALRRAAALGDGWHGLYLSPDQARAAVATLDEFGHADAFGISMRTMTRVGGAIEDAEPETVLHGDPAEIVQQIERYAAAGVQHLIIEPVSRDLDDFLDQINRFAHDVITPTGPQPTHA
jgi:alkanesulfonate monooxygenase SsuD/methylene tetrahydromethanopterin reductase-like flavin-dependent oxidoreductase (luciferase family)